MKIHENQWKSKEIHTFWICQNLENTVNSPWIRREFAVKIRGFVGSADMHNFAKIIGKINEKSMKINENPWKSLKNQWKSMKIHENP